MTHPPDTNGAELVDYDEPSPFDIGLPECAAAFLGAMFIVAVIMGWPR